MVKKWVSWPNKEKQTYWHICAFILLANVRTYPLDSLLNIMEQEDQFFNIISKYNQEFKTIIVTTIKMTTSVSLDSKTKTNEKSL